MALGATVPSSVSAQSPCADADASPAAASDAQLRAATLCLMNAERAQRGARALRTNARLQQAAEIHAADMVRHRYFAHDSRNGERFSARIARAGYMRGASWWRVGENLAWGSGELATPRRIVAAWMASPGHRRNLLDDSFRDVGIGVVPAAPNGQSGQAGTYVTDFGVRSGASRTRSSRRGRR